MSGLYSPGVLSGEVLLPKFQYDFLSKDRKEDFVRVRTRDTWMWRYKDAETVYVPPKVNLPVPKGDVLDQWELDEKVLYNNFLDALTDPTGVSLIEGDDDEEFTYGILCIVLADMGYQEMDWLLDKEFGSMYSLRNISQWTEDEDEGEE
jgi:hypothetical protein